MVSLGEVEFLVKFDTIGQSFKDVLISAMGDQEVDVDFTEIQDELRYIRSYLGVLKTPFSGNYEIDILKKRAYVKQLESEEYFEKIVSLAKVSETILGYFTGEKGKVKAGSEEAEDVAREGVEIAFKRILDFMAKAFASPATYTIYSDKMNKILKMFEAGTETAMNYLIGPALKMSISESEVDRNIVKEIEAIIEESTEEAGEIGDEVEDQVKATITDAKALFSRIKIELQAEEESLDTSWDHIIKKQSDFTKAVDEFVSKENISELFTSQGIEFKGVLRDEIEEMLKFVTFEVADVLYPHGFVKTVAAIKDIKKMKDIVGDIGVVPDVRAIMTNFEDAWEVIEKFTTLKKDKDIQKLKEDVEEAFDTYGWLFMLWENKKWTTRREMLKDLQKYPEEMKPQILGAAPFGTGGLTTKPELVDIPETRAEIIELMKEEDPEKMKMAINKLLEKMRNVLGVTEDIWGEIPVMSNSLRELLELLKIMKTAQLSEL